MPQHPAPAGPADDATDAVAAARAEDRALLSAHVGGDPDAFAALVRRHQDRLWAVALRTLGDREEAADALQDALVKAFRSADGFRGDAAVTTWLHRIVVNACIDRTRRRAVRPTVPLPEDEDRRAELGADDRADDPAEARQRRIDVLAALQEIPADQRAALVLVDMEGYSVAEAADLLGTAPGTVKSRCSRGRSRLAPLLGAWRNRPAPGAVPPEGARAPTGGRRAPDARVDSTDDHGTEDRR